MCVLKHKWGLFVVISFVATIMIVLVAAVHSTFIDTAQIRAKFNIYYINEQIDLISTKHFTLVTVVYMLVYVAYVIYCYVCSLLNGRKWALCIPGIGLLLNLVGGRLYGVQLGLPLSLVRSDVMSCLLIHQVLVTTGSFLCYLLSLSIGKGIISNSYCNFSSHVMKIQSQLDAKKDNLLFYLVSFRFFPGPQWLLNLASPHLGIPKRTFLIATFIGFIPINLVGFQAGEILGRMKTSDGDLGSLGDVIDSSVLGRLALLALMVLAVPLARHYFATHLATLYPPSQPLATSREGTSCFDDIV